MPSINQVPLASGDLQLIADLLVKIDEDETGFFTSAHIGRIEVIRDGTDELIGHLIPFDDWYGFLPLLD